MYRLGVAPIALLAATTAQAVPVCEAALPPPLLDVRVPLSDGFIAASRGRTAPHRTGLSAGFDPAYSVERVLRRQQWEACREAIALALAPAAAAPLQHGDYIKQTEFDNTPYRFNMTQNGKRMTADDFDAWLEINGYSVGRRVADTEQ